MAIDSPQHLNIPAESDFEALRWFEREQKEHARRKSHILNGAMCASEILSLPSPPEWFLRDLEYHYRKGFYHAIAEASELIGRLHKLGYTRPMEISNILSDLAYDLRSWKAKALRETPLLDYGHPPLNKWKSWKDIKQEVKLRDNNQCVHCGSTEDLECHHVISVARGGLPEFENLITLCETCHKRE